MASGSSSTSAYSDNDTEILHVEDTKLSKELTTIESKISVITEKKKVKVSTKFIHPHGQNVFLAMKTAEALFDKIQKLPE